MSLVVAARGAAAVRARRDVVVLGVAVAATQLLRPPVPVAVDVLGAVAAAALCLHAAGVILVLRSHRFVNFAQVSLGVVAATTYTTIVHGRPAIRAVRAVCPPCLGRTTPAVRDVNLVFGLFMGMAVAVGGAWLLHRAFVRRFRGAPTLVLTVASLFVAQALAGLDELIPKLLTTQRQREVGLAVRAAAPLPFDVTVHAGSAVVHLADMLLVLCALAATVALPMWLRRSPSGAVLRAAADHPVRAATAGIDVDRVNDRVWLLAGALAGAAGLLTAMTLGGGASGAGTPPVGLLVRILAIVAVARFTSLSVAGVAALAIGLAEQSVFRFAGSSTIVDTGLVVLVAVVLMSRGYGAAAGASRAGAPSAWPGTREPRPVPVVLRTDATVRSAARTVGGALAAVLLAAPFLLAPGQLSATTDAFAHAIAGLSLLVLTGWAGAVSLGQLAFAAVAAAVVGGFGVPAALALPVAALVGAAVAVAVGVPARRLPGLHLSVITLAFALAVDAFVLGPRGLGRHLPSVVARPAFLGLHLDDGRTLYYVTLLVVAAATALVMRLRRSGTGRALIAARDNESAAAAFGIDVARARLAAFGLSGALAGISGVLLMWQAHGVRALAFSPAQSLAVFVFTVIGGLGSVIGPLLGFGYEAVTAVLSLSPLTRSLLSGLGGLTLLLVAPGGLAQSVFAARDAFLRRVALRRHLDVPDLAVSTADTGPAPIAPLRALADPAVRYELAGQWAITDG